jgi:hypothetical protein
MRSSLGAGVAVVLLLALAGCGQAEQPDARASSIPRSTTAPEVRVFSLLDRGPLSRADHSEGTVELTGAATLEGFVPPRAFPDDQLPELPTLPEGARRFAAIITGCQEQQPPEISRQQGGWRLRFADNGVRCVVADHYIVVWDVSP